jgi:SAM-dependent methyltransferase
MPPEELRALVGRPDVDAFNGTPDDEETLGLVPSGAFGNVLDFGCGCGRVTRTLLERRLVARYVGIDCNRPMIEWCRAYLAPLHNGLQFEHHDVYNAGLNPAGKQTMLPLPGAGYTLILASSVFTHLPQREAEYYLSEAARVLAADGHLLATFFFFDRRPFPMMQSFQHALYINQDDITNAVLFSREWLYEQLERNGLELTRELAPPSPNHQWRLLIRHSDQP